MTYDPGDALGVYPVNPPNIVLELINSLVFDADERVTVEEKSLSIKEAFLRHLEITTLTRPMLQKYATLINHTELLGLLDDDRRHALNEYLTGRQLIDLITDFPCHGGAR